jgi:hypothetical protein
MDAFIDESGTHAGADLLTVACCFGTESKWKHFLEQWDEPEFHAKDAPDALKQKLSDLMCACELDAMVCFVRPAQYKTRTSAQWQSAIGNAYAACSFACALGLKKIFPEERFAYVIEEGQPNTDWVVRVLRALSLSEPFRDRIGMVATASKKAALQLHTADFIAHSWSTQNKFWMSEIGDHIYEQDITPSLDGMSDELREIIQKRKWKQRQKRV